MKHGYGIIYTLMALSLVIAWIFLAFLPDQVPMHYNITGEIDRFGSKYENLLLPFFSVLMGFMMTGMAKYHKRRGERGNEKTLVITGIFCVLFFDLMEIYFLWKAAAYPAGGVQTNGPDAMKFVSMILGALLIFCGNIMPKAGRNAVFGLRTRWSMKNDRVWQQSQRFCGYACVVCGLLMILVGLFVSGAANLLAVLGLVIVWAVVSAAASYRICKKDGADREKES